ncbi:DNA recombination protein RmuC [Luteimonas gilva]|uniref:DNA recombination protein RmuC n=1 Tax=Luteimonas gilva TaxID=2572684 RepID=UPI001677BFBB|nr:DNA recombination protein RmuC [Luteimonas gilva]
MLQLVQLLRRGDRSLESALRDEQREGRGELRQQLDSLSAAQEQRILGFGSLLNSMASNNDQRMEDLRETLTEDARKSRSETALALRDFAAALDARVAELSRNNETRLGEMRATLEQQLLRLQADNAQKLEQMRATVDEKLQTTLETRLGASFKLVSERLEQVQRGLGEMQQLAVGVGDLKRVLGNVKTRGTFGEVQLGALLEQVLTIEQYETNCVTVPGSSERVEFAVRLPGTQNDQPIRLPIDAKFPREDYERLLDAQDRADADAMAAASAGLERQVKVEAKRIRDKYLAPPHTTDFALLFLPTEGLYAEVLRRPGLFDGLQREFRVTLVGPTTLLALLNSLQMGFRTLAIEKRSSEVWQLLGAVKAEFGKFAGILEKAHGQLDTVQNSLKQAGVRTRAIEKQLKGVETLPGAEAQHLIGDAVRDDESE